MMPVLPPGTLVAARRPTRMRQGDVVIFYHEGREKIKRISELKDGRVYLLGDHADASTDSRQFGWIPLEMVIAKVIWPRNLQPIIDI